MVNCVNPAYCQPLRENRIYFWNGHLVLFHHLGSLYRFLALIIVPEKLWLCVFQIYHVSRSVHLGREKTLIALRSRFFWPHMKNNIIDWVKECTGCITGKHMSLKRSGLVFSWPVTTPFAIVSVDIRSPGDISSDDGQKYLFGNMCDMSQFVVIQGCRNKESSTVAHLLMEGFLLKFGLCLMIICDQGSENRKIFEKACGALNIRIHPVAKHNHRAVGVERFFKVMLPDQKLCAEECATPKAFVECGAICAYA